MNKKLLLAQTILLAAGVVYSWSKVVNQFQTFYAKYGAIFRVKDCTYPNPLVTACFYGAVAFLLAFAWSLKIYLDKEPQLVCEGRLRWFLLFGVCFALSVIAFEFILYYKIYRPAGPIIACQPGVFPLKTPCFVGFNIYLIGFILSSYIVKKVKPDSATPLVQKVI